MARVTLTKAELETEAGKNLVALIERIGSDSDISLGEVSELLAAVGDRGPFAHISGAAYLNEIILQIIADGSITVYEMEKLRSAMARVLPKKSRDEFTATFGPISFDVESPKAPWYYNSITERQVELMIKLGISVSPSMTKGEASELISEKLENKENEPSPRQMMILRFWDRLDLSGSNRRQICDWMESWYSENPERKEAWERFKKSRGGDIAYADDVPLGIGKSWLEVRSESDRALIPVISASKEVPYSGGQIEILPHLRARPKAESKGILNAIRNFFGQKIKMSRTKRRREHGCL